MTGKLKLLTHMNNDNSLNQNYCIFGKIFRKVKRLGKMNFKILIYIVKKIICRCVLESHTVSVTVV